MYLCYVERLSRFQLKLDFFRNFKSFPRNRAKVPVLQYRVFGQISPKMKRRKFSIYIFFSDPYTCTYVV